MPELAHARPFSGGLPLRPFKALSTGTTISTPPMPRQLVIAMAQHAGPAAEPIVAPGETIERGQMIGAPGRSGAVAVHSAARGQVVAVEERIIPTGSRLVHSPCIVVATTPDQPPTTARQHLISWPAERAARLDAIRMAGIVGLGGATFPTNLKLGSGRACRTLILNGAECEPYISCDDMLMRERADDLLLGAAVMLDMLGAQCCLVAIERDKRAAIDAIEIALRSRGDARFRLAIIPTVYPAGGERQLVESLMGEEVPSGGLPINLGIVCQNVGTAYALADLVLRGEPLLTRVVTLTGHGLANPQNVEAPIGISIRDLLDFCGGLRNEACRLILGGNMMGYASPSDDIPITKATNCIIALTEDEVPESGYEWPCIRCGDCAGACPARLQPQELLRAVRRTDHARLDELGVDDCIECGCCDVVCPSHIPLTSILREGREALEHHRIHAQRAAAADLRYALHVEREEREAAERRLEQTRLTAPVTGDEDARRAAIEASIERARKRRQTAKKQK